MSDIKRRLSILPPLSAANNSLEQPSEFSNLTVLVLNSNRDMANEIARQLIENVQGCQIVYAPTLGLGKLLLKRNNIDLVVSSPILPDGHITKLQPLLESLKQPPDVIVFGDDQYHSGLNLFDSPSYKFISVKNITSESSATPVGQVAQELRDALNNPLQEIVALIYVAHATECSAVTNQALIAIEKAAQRMAGIVWGIEERLYRNVVGADLRQGK